MARRTFIFDDPDRFAAGTVGQPGNRTFFLQARASGRVVSVAVEKSQVSALAERLGQLLVELDRQGIVEDVEAPIEPDERPLDEPLNEVFRTGSLTLGWDGEAERVLVEARAQIEVESVEEAIEAIQKDDDDEDGPDLLRVRVSAAAARTFVERAHRIVRAGRPTCPLCGNPLEPTGHICPRKNGQYVH